MTATQAAATQPAIPGPEAPYLAQIDRLMASVHDEPESLRRMRSLARERFQALGFPSPRHEAWRFTSLKPILTRSFSPASPRQDQGPGRVAGDLLDRWRVKDSIRLVFLDGQLVSDLSSTSPLPRDARNGVVISSLSEAIEEHPDLVTAHLGRHPGLQDHAFVALNTASIRDGAFIWLAPHTVLEQPIQVVWVSSAEDSPVASYPRTLIVAAEASQATVVESYVGEQGSYLSCPVTEIALSEGAVLSHSRIQDESTDAHHVGAVQVRQDRDSRLSSTTISVGAALARLDIETVLGGPGADTVLDGLYLADGEQHVDHHLLVRHSSPHATSNQLFKGILDGSSRAVFNGRIVVDKDAQRTDARQSNRNLLLSDRSRVSSNPQLEIFADDVRCTHGSTVGTLDDEALFYLRSRGIPRAAAESLLTYAFAGDIVRRVQLPEIRERLESILLERLPQGDLVREVV
jgi:Fe-S cluster assembly protein SufD